MRQGALQGAMQVSSKQDKEWAFQLGTARADRAGGLKSQSRQSELHMSTAMHPLLKEVVSANMSNRQQAAVSTR